MSLPILPAMAVMPVSNKAMQMDGWIWRLLQHQIRGYAAMPSMKVALLPLTLPFTVLNSTRIRRLCLRRTMSSLLPRALAYAKTPVRGQTSSPEARLRIFSMLFWPGNLPLRCRPSWKDFLWTIKRASIWIVICWNSKRSRSRSVRYLRKRAGSIWLIANISQA